MLSRPLRALPAAILAIAFAVLPAAVVTAAPVPVPSAPAISFRLSAIDAHGVPLRATWGHGGASGIASYQVQLRIDGGSWTSLKPARKLSTRVGFRVPPPHEAQVRVRATNGAGVTGPWVAGPAFRVRRYAETSSAATLGGTWATVSSPGFLGGHAYRATERGATVDVTFSGHMAAIIGRKGPKGGSLTLWETTTSPVGIQLYASSRRDRLVLGQTTWSAQGSRTMHARVDRPNAWFDGYVVLDDPAPDPVLVGAGDIATCGLAGDNRTARLLDGIAGRVFAAGDAVYPSGSKAQFRDCYAPTWGRWRLRTSPVPGNHDYHTTGAAGYFGYFGSRAGERGRGWYAYNLGTWRIYNLNANCSQVGCGLGSAQVRWLEADLAAHPRACVAAIWHQPLFSSGYHGGTAAVRTLWQVLDAAGADIVLNGHDHDYERFAPQDADGRADPDGMVEFVVGTGGADLRPFVTVTANSIVRDHSSHGVLKLTLRPGAYEFEFVPVPGAALRDTGSGACR
jgi:Calcineurin-like phosphoesterase